jgi:hypothetical protein
MSFHDTVFDIVAVDPINRVEDLLLGQTMASLPDQVLENVPLTAWERQRQTIDLRIATVEEDLEPVRIILRFLSSIRIHPPPNRL